MAIVKEHEMHKRRFGRNMGVGLTLLAFVALVYGLTVAKMQRGESMEAADHSPRISIIPAEPSE
ncbi:MAG: hypothetical protein L3J30_03570 [Marinosulfonomonas sp.]|nr:hypothetical protein [Marinosulfonomonas sp.]